MKKSTNSQAERLVLLSPEPNSTSETFIRAHRDRLPFAVIPLYRWRAPYQTAQGRWLAPVPALLRRFAAGLRLQSLARLFQRWITLRVAHWLRQVGASAVLAEYGPLGANIASACRQAGVPLVVIFHGFDAFQDITLQTYFEAYQQLFRTAAALVVVSEPMREQLIQLGAPPERIQVNSCGVDPSAFTAAEPGSAPPTFLAVGRFVGKKGPLHTIDAFARVHQRQPESRLRMIGSGPLLAECRARADQLGLAEAITVLGDCPHATVREQMRQVRAVVQHSLRCASGDQEGTPVALIEAQMAGLPVVSTLHAGIPAVVVNSRTGFLVEEGDVEGMAAAMLRLAAESALAASMGAAARRHALAHHTLDRHINALADTLHHAIASAAQPAP